MAEVQNLTYLDVTEHKLIK